MTKQSGFSLVEILVAAAILTTVGIAFGTLMNSMVRQQKNLQQKAEMMEAKQNLLASFASGGVCTCQLATKEFDSTKPEGTQMIGVGGLAAGCGPSALRIADEGEKLPATQSGLVVKSVRLTAIRRIDPTNPATPFQGTLEITIDPQSLLSTRAPVSIEQKFFADLSDPTRAKIVGCLGANTPNCRVVTAVQASGVGGIATSCAPGETLTGGGGECDPMEKGKLTHSMPLSARVWWAVCFRETAGLGSVEAVGTRVYGICCS